MYGKVTEMWGQILLTNVLKERILSLYDLITLTTHALALATEDACR